MSGHARMEPFEFLTSWHAWFRTLRWSEFALIMWPLLFLELPRYVLSKIVLLCLDIVRGQPKPTSYDHCPTVTVVLAGYNEANTVGPTIESIVGT